MTDPDIEAACEDITKGLKTHRGCSPGTAVVAGHSVKSAYDDLCVKFSGVHQDDEIDSILLRLHHALKLLGVNPLGGPIDVAQAPPAPPKELHWLGDRDSADITRHAIDMRGCVMYFDQQSDCLQFMRWLTALPVSSTNRSSPAATIGDIPSEPRPPASAAMGLSAGGEALPPADRQGEAQ